MTDEALHNIELLTAADYIDALKKIAPTDSQWEMLRVHMAAPDHVITVRHIARALGFPNWNTTNLLYGKFAGKLCKELNVSPSTHLSVLVTFSKAPDAEYDLHLRPAVIEALKEFGLSGSDKWQPQEELGNEEPLVEGASFTVRVNAFERNPVARKKCIDHYGTGCAVCGFSFGAAYGSAADGYIHIHHLQPLASIGEEYVIDPVKDLRPVCANCHAVIHMRQPPYSIKEVKIMLSGDTNA